MGLRHPHGLMRPVALIQQSLRLTFPHVPLLGDFFLVGKGLLVRIQFFLGMGEHFFKIEEVRGRQFGAIFQSGFGFRNHLFPALIFFLKSDLLRFGKFNLFLEVKKDCLQSGCILPHGGHHFLLLLEFPGIQMFFCRAFLLFHTTFDLEATILQMPRQFVLQFPERGLGVDILGAKPSIRRHRHMKEVHVRRLFIHMHHCRDDIFPADKIGEIGRSFRKKASDFLLAHAGKERFVRTDNQATHMHGILADNLDHEQIVNAILDGLRVVV